MRLFRPRNLLILAIIGAAIAILASKKNRPADPLPTVSYSPPAPKVEEKADDAGDDAAKAEEAAEADA